MLLILVIIKVIIILKYVQIYFYIIIPLMKSLIKFISKKIHNESAGRWSRGMIPP